MRIQSLLCIVLAILCITLVPWAITNMASAQSYGDDGPANNTVYIDITDPTARVRHRGCTPRDFRYQSGDELILATEAAPHRVRDRYVVVRAAFPLTDSHECWGHLDEGSQVVYIRRAQ